jgi:flagellar FliL protein
VNLRSDSEEQFLQVAMTLSVKEQADADQIKLYMPEVRNRMLLLLSSKAGSEILTPEGKQKLSEEIIATLKKPFAPNTKQQGINNVFFTSFVVQ